MNKLLQVLEQNCTMTDEQLASMADMTVEEVRETRAKLEEDRIILGYQAIVDWDRTQREAVTALIEVKVTPQRGEGFDRIAERIYQYDEVESVYLMSGAFDLTVIISGRTLKEVASFVGERLAPLEDVTGTATHFILKKYKEKHLIFQKQEQQEREFIFT
jgi:DNA-binding Lrp family transcriptional regulator